MEQIEMEKSNNIYKEKQYQLMNMSKGSSGEYNMNFN